MNFWVAGSNDVNMWSFFLDKGNQIRRIAEVFLGWKAFDVIPAQGQNPLDPNVIQGLEDVADLVSGQIGSRQVGNRGDLELVVDVVSQAHGRFFHIEAAVAARHTDKMRGQVLHLLEGLEYFCIAYFWFWRKNFKGEAGSLTCHIS